MSIVSSIANWIRSLWKAELTPEHTKQEVRRQIVDRRHAISHLEMETRSVTNEILERTRRERAARLDYEQWKKEHG